MKPTGPRQVRVAAVPLSLVILLMAAACRPAADIPESHEVAQLINVAVDKAVVTSGVHESFASVNAVDNDIATSWIVATSAGSWIEVDLGEDRPVYRIELVVEQTPEGETTHHVLGKGDGESRYRELLVFDGATSDGQILAHAPAVPWTGLRWIKVETARTPSWVGWKEIRVFSPG